MALPAAVSDRILRRILLFASPFALLGFASGPLSYVYLRSHPAAAGESASAGGLYAGGTLLFFLSALGISYGVLSASWDGGEGSALGWEEFKRNAETVRLRLWNGGD